MEDVFGQVGDLMEKQQPVIYSKPALFGASKPSSSLSSHRKDNLSQ
jgi:hypothetical protein